MDIENMFPQNACSLDGRNSIGWTWDTYFEKKEQLKDKIVLVDMIGHPVPGSIPLSNSLFENKKYSDGTYFVLYCHSGGTSGAMQKKLTPHYPEYRFVNLLGGIGQYPR